MRLGDEWQDWDGKIEETESSATVFLLLSFAVFVVFAVFLLFAEYLVSPRLAGIHHFAPLVLRMLVTGAILFMFTWIFLIALSTLTGIDFLFGLDKRLYGVLMLIPYVSGIAKRLNISRDKVAHSFIRLHNNIVSIRKRHYQPCDIVVLLPKCLRLDVRKRVVAICNKYNLRYFILAGGEAARAVLSRLKPKATVAVACERDLLSGIRDVASKVVVLGVPNRRPHGPCTNTTADVKEFEKSIRFLLGMPA